jgi:U3 small nucleolar ribonucleoprotein protein IMP4
MDVLKYLFPVPKEDSKRVMTFANEDDFISFRRVLTYVVSNSSHESLTGTMSL